MSTTPTLTLQSARYQESFAAFVHAVEEALKSAPPGAQATAWRQRALPLLQRDLTALRTAASADDHAQVVRHAADTRLLARRMDGYRLDFAGDASGTVLTERRRMAIIAAAQLCHAAGLA